MNTSFGDAQCTRRNAAAVAYKRENNRRYGNSPYDVIKYCLFHLTNFIGSESVNEAVRTMASNLVSPINSL